MKNAGSFFQELQERRARSRAIDARIWRAYCGDRETWICTGLMLVRFGIYLIIGAFAGLGFVLVLAPGVSLAAFALPFSVLWHRAPALLMLATFGAFVACLFHVYGRVGYRMAKDAWAKERAHNGCESRRPGHDEE